MSMSTALNLPYTRFVRQASTATCSNPQWHALMLECLERLKTADWTESMADPAAVAMPINNPLTFVHDDRYDAFKASRTVADSGMQSCHMGMAAYRYKLPADASDTFISALAFSAGADKFASAGLNISAVLSDSPSPPNGWDLLRAGGHGSAVDATGAFRSASAATVTFSGLPKDGDSVTVASKTYRLKRAPSAVNDVLLGSSVAATVASLAHAVNGDGTPGTDYYTGTVTQDGITAAAGTSSLTIAAATGAAPSVTCSSAFLASRTVGILPSAEYLVSADQNKAAAFSLDLSAVTDAYLYLYVIVMLYDYTDYRLSRQYWIEGSGVLNGAYVLTTFDGAVTPDAADLGRLSVLSGGVSPAPLNPADAARRELVMRDTVLPRATSACAVSALPAVFARLRASGAEQVDVSARPLAVPRDTQLGLSCSLVRTPGSGPTLYDCWRYAACPLAVHVALPPAFRPASLSVTNPAGSAALSVSGADVRLSFWWLPEQLAALATVGELLAAPAALIGGAPAGATPLGRCVMPSSLAAASSFRLPVSGIEAGAWGTLLVIPWIARVTAAQLPYGVPVGIEPGLDVADDAVSGSAWSPDLEFIKA